MTSPPKHKSRNTSRLTDVASRILQANSIVLDVDYDFFCGSEHVSTGKPDDKKINYEMFREFFQLNDPELFQPVVGHDESLQVWLDRGIRAATCIHFDYHHDCYISSDRLNASSISRLDEVINIGNYLPFAKKGGALSHVIWVTPDELIDAEVDEYVSAWKSEDFLSIISWSEYLELHHIMGANLVRSGHTAALSPDFVSPSDFEFFFDLFDCDDEFRYRAFDYGYFSVLADRRDMGWRWHSIDLSSRSQTFFHGSPIQGLTRLEQTHRHNFVSPSKRFASCFESNLVRTDAVSMGIEPFGDDPDTVVVSGDSKLLDTFTTGTGSTYVISLDETPIDFSPGCQGFEFTTEAGVDVCAEMPGELSRAVQNDPGFLVVYPHELMTIPDVLSDEGEGRFLKWMGVSDAVVSSFPSTVFYFHVFEELQTGKASPFLPLITWTRFASRELFPALKPLGIATEANGYHGLQHCLDVGLLAVVLSYLHKTPATPVFLAALTHDLRRDAPRDQHNAKDSAVLCQELIEGPWGAYTSEFDLELFDAVAVHSSLHQAPSVIAKILRDADRVRLSWERGFEERFFETDWGKEFAKRDSSFAENILTRLSLEAGSVLEINLLTGIAELAVLQQKFACPPILITDAGARAWFINQYKVSKIVVRGAEQAEDYPQFRSPFLRDGVMVVSDQQAGVSLRSELSATLHKAALPMDGVAQLTEISDEEEVHIRVNPETIDEVMEVIDCINNRQVSLVVPGVSAEAISLTRRLIAGLKTSSSASEEGVGAKIICEVAWCHFLSPEDALTYFEKIEQQYSPIVSPPILSVAEDMVRAVVEYEKERHDTCGECPYSLHCSMRDLVDGSWRFGTPEHQSKFQGWNPYVAN